MKKYLALLVTLLFASGAWGQATCTQQCGEQNFNTPTDPFNTDGARRWSYHVELSGAGSPIEWNSEDGYIQRRFLAASNNSDAFVRYNGNIAQNGCMAYQIIESDDGATGTNGFEPGFVLRHQTTYNGSASDPVAPINPTPVFDTTVWNNNTIYYTVRCEDGMDCDTLRFSTNAQNYDFTNDTCNLASGEDFGDIAEGDWIGACVDSTGIGTVVRVFNLGAADPGSPDDIEGSGWGAPECVLDACSNDIGGCDNAGNAFGIWMRTNTVSAGAIYQVDNARFYSCM